MSLRARLLAAFAYVLVLVIVALLVPLALNLSRRVDAEIRSEARGQAQLVAASVSGRLDERGELERLASNSARDLRGRVIVVGERGRLLVDSEEAVPAGTSYASRPEIAAALRRQGHPGRAPQRLARRGPALHSGAGGQRRPAGGRRPGDPERRRRRRRGAQRRARADRGRGGGAPARARAGLAARRLARAPAARDWPARRGGSPRAISTRGRARRARPSSVRWRPRSTT